MVGVGSSRGRVYAKILFSHVAAHFKLQSLNNSFRILK